MKKMIRLFPVSFLLAGLLVVLLSGWSAAGKNKREYYQLSVYHYSTIEQETILDNYLQNALLPALHRNKISNVGVFKAIANDTAAAKSLYVLIPARSLEVLLKLPEKLNDDNLFQTAGAAYINADSKNAPYTRMETILLHAFPLAPQLQLPQLKGAKKERVYELRSYESATEKFFKNKVQMFNEGGEIALFKSLNFNAAFYSEVIAGDKMPNLMYMTCFENMADRKEHWKQFSSNPDWKKLSSLPEYKNNVSHIDISFLYPVEYSDF
ncbi:MAG TPA: NIPSNAP family protein [Chitinophagaceae bacterium]